MGGRGRRERAPKLVAAAALALKQAADEGLELMRSHRSVTGYLGVYRNARSEEACMSHGTTRGRLGMGIAAYRARIIGSSHGKGEQNWLGMYDVCEATTRTRDRRMISGGAPEC